VLRLLSLAVLVLVVHRLWRENELAAL